MRCDGATERQAGEALRVGARRASDLDEHSPHSGSATLLRAVTGVLVLAYLLSTVLRTSGSTISLFDGWVGNLGYGGCALLCAWRAYAVPAQLDLRAGVDAVLRRWCAGSTPAAGRSRRMCSSRSPKRRS
ncbi:MAG TPA: hypothetical protein VE442_07390 [Jatrophihabitans sp.]|nr:hypothetical protein [Jatrophihabitans sp.]